MGEENNRIIDISVVFQADTTSLDPAVDKLNEAQETVDKIQYADMSMPNLTRLTRGAVNAAGYVAENTRERARKYSEGPTEYDTERLTRRLEHSYKEAGALYNLYGGNNTAFSLSRQKSFMDSLDDDMKRLLDSTTVELANMIKTVTSENYKGRGRVRERDMDLFAQSFENRNMEQVSHMFSKVRQAKGYNRNIEKQFIEYVAARTLSPTYFNEYSRERFGKNITSDSFDFNISDILPQRYMGAWRSESRSYASSRGQNDDIKYLKKNFMDVLDEELSQDPLLVQSAIEAGIATRKKNGQLERFQNISADQIARLRETSYENLIASAMGFLGQKEFFLDKDRAIKRISSGNAGRLLASMTRLEDFNDSAFYTPTSNLDTDTTVAIAEPKRVKKMYGSVKINLASKNKTETMNAINESQITRLLGYDSRPNHSHVEDEMLTLELGSDYEAVKDQIDEIRKNGYTRNGIKYRFHAAHRSDEGVDLRMLSEAAMNRVNKQYAPLAEQMGIPGRNILDLFEDPETFKDFAINGKHNDAVNKLYTDSYLIANGKNFDNKVAIIDTSSFDDNGVKQTLADGIMFAAKGLVSASGQVRMGLAGKGTLRSVGGENDTTLRRYLIDSGLATYEGQKPENWSYDDKNWHYYAKGVGGDIIDAIDAGYIVDASFIKNKGIFANNRGKKLTSEEANRSYEKLLNATGLAYVQDFDKEDRFSDHLGIQAMAYMRIPQSIKDFQLNGYEKRLEELNTSTGVLKYVFSNDMGNPYARQLDQNPELINNPTIQKMVSAYTERLYHDVSSGALVDFGLDENSKFMNERLTQDLMYQHFRTNGISDEKMAQAREKLRYGMADRYGKASDETLDEVIKDTMMLREGNVIDYALEDFKDLSISRSPSGFGTLVHAKNRAKERLALEDVFGKVTDKTGLQIGAEDAKTLSTADYDADTAKVATGVYAEMMKASAEFMDELISKIDFDRIKSKALEGSAESWEEADKQFIARLFEEPLGMGRGDAAGRRAVLFELNKPENRKLLRGALKGQDVYDFFSTFGKKPGTIEDDSDVSDLMKVGREYSKFSDNIGEAVNQDLIRNAIREAAKNEEQDKLNIFESKQTGLQVNLDTLKGLKLANTNLPSIFNDAQRMAVETVGKMSLLGADNSKMIAVSEALEHLAETDPDMENAGYWTKRLANTKNALLTQFAGGRTMVTAEEEKAMRTMMSRSRDEIDDYVYDHKELWYDENAKSDTNESGFIGIEGARRKLQRQYGLHTVENFLDKFGMTESRTRAVFGDDYTDELKAIQGDRFSIGDDIAEIANPAFIPAEIVEKVKTEAEEFKAKTKEIQSKLDEINPKPNKTRKSTKSATPEAVTAEIEELVKSNEAYDAEIAHFEQDDADLNAGIISELRKKKEENQKKIQELKAASTKGKRSKKTSSTKKKEEDHNPDVEAKLKELDNLYRDLSEADDQIAEIEKLLQDDKHKGAAKNLTWILEDEKSAKEQVLKDINDAKEFIMKWSKPASNNKTPGTQAAGQAPVVITGNGAADMVSAMSVKDYLEEGRGLTSEFFRTIYKTKDKSYSDNFLRSGSARVYNYFKKQEDLLKNPDLTKQQAAEINEASVRAQNAWYQASSQFAKDRSEQLSRDLFSSQSTSGNVFKFSSSRMDISKQYNEFFDLERAYMDAVKELDGRGINTYRSKDILALVRSRAKEAEALFQRASELIDKQFNEFFDAKTEAAQKLVEEQEEEASLKSLNLTNNTSSARMYRSVLGQRKGLEKNIDSIKKQYDAAVDELAGYQNDYDILNKKGNLTEEEIAKAVDLANAIDKTTDRVNILKQALANANQELSNFNSVDSIQMLDETISETTSSLRMMATATNRSASLDKILRISSNMSDARKVNEQMLGENPDDAALQGYNNRKKEIDSWAQHYDDVIRLDDMSMNNFIEQYSKGMVSTPADNVNQFFNSKQYAGEHKIAELNEYLIQYQEALAKSTETAEKIILQNRIDKIKSDIESITNLMTGFEGNREGEVSFAYDSAMKGVQIQGLSNLYKNAQYTRGREIEDYRRANRFRNSAFARGYTEVLSQRNRYQTAIENDTLQIQNLQRARAQEQHALDQKPNDEAFAALQNAKIGNIDKQIESLTQRIYENQQALSQYSGVGATASAALQQLSARISQTFRMFGRRMFRQVLNEAKQFVQQYDKAMTSIQQVTLKTDEQMQSLGKSLIQTAVDMKTNISDIMNMATSLYRQGLTDSEVQDRLETIAKFTNVSNVKTEDASKLLTVIMNSGMATSSGRAMDIVSAISDSAATDGAQIAKALQRSLYAASTSNVSLEQLISMAAAITSKTQMGGATAGTTLSNVMNRMTRVGKGEIVYDESGNAVGQTKLRDALRMAGIDLYDENGNVDVFGTLTKLGRWWGENEDNTTVKSAISNALAGTGRQANNFQALIEAFSEVDESGKTLIETFIGIAESADGIVDKKFDVYTKSLAAASAELKSSFDQLVDSLNVSGAAVGAIEIVSYILQGLAELNANTGLLTFTGVVTGLGALGVALSHVSTPILALVGVIGTLGAVSKGVSDMIEKSSREYQAEQQAKRVQQGEAAVERINKITNSYKDSKAGTKWKDEDIQSFSVAIAELESLGFISKEASDNIRNLSESGFNVSGALDEIASAIISTKDSIVNSEFASTWGNRRGKYLQNASEAGAGTLTFDRIWDTIMFLEESLKDADSISDEEFDAKMTEYDLIVQSMLNDETYKQYNKDHPIDKEAIDALHRYPDTESLMGLFLPDDFNYANFSKMLRIDNDEAAAKEYFKTNIRDGYNLLFGTKESITEEESNRDILKNGISRLSGVSWDEIIPDNTEFADVKGIAADSIIDVMQSAYAADANKGELTFDQWVDKNFIDEQGSLVIDSLNNLIKDNVDIITNSIAEKTTQAETDGADNTLNDFYASVHAQYQNNILGDYRKSYERWLQEFGAIKEYGSVSNEAIERWMVRERDALTGPLTTNAELNSVFETMTNKLEEGKAIDMTDIDSFINVVSKSLDSIISFENGFQRSEKLTGYLNKLNEGISYDKLLSDSTQSFNEAEKLASIIGTDYVREGGNAFNAISQAYAQAQIDENTLGLKAELTNQQKALAAEDIAVKLSQGKPLKEAIEGYSESVVQYLYNNVAHLEDYVSESQKGIINDNTANELGAEIRRLKSSYENLSDQALEWISGLYSPIAETRLSTQNEVRSRNEELNKLKYYIDNIDYFGYEQFSTNAEMQQVLMDALNISDTSQMLNMYKRSTESKYAKHELMKNLNAAYTEGYEDIVNVSENTPYEMTTEAYNPLINIATQYEAGDAERKQYSNIVDRIIGKSFEDAFSIIVGQNLFTMLGLTENQDIQKYIARAAKGEQLSAAEKNSVIKSIYENAGRIQEYYASIQSQFAEIDEAIDAASKGEYDSSKHFVINPETAEMLRRGRYTNSIEWLRDYYKGEALGVSGYSAKNESLIGIDLYNLLTKGNYMNAKGKWEQMPKEQRDVIDNLSGGIINEIMSNISGIYENNRLVSFGFKTPEIAEEMRSKLADMYNAFVQNMFFGFNSSIITDWQTGIDEYKNKDSDMSNISKFWNAYSSFLQTSDEMKTVSKAMERYNAGDRAGGIISLLSSVLNLDESIIKSRPTTVKERYDDYVKDFNKTMDEFFKSQLPDLDMSADMSTEDLAEFAGERGNEALKILIEDGCIKIEDGHIDVSDSIGAVSAALNSLISQTADDIRNSSNALNYAELLSVLTPLAGNEAFMDSGFNSSDYMYALALQFKDNPEAMERLTGFMSNDQEFRTMQYLGNSGYLTYNDMYSYMQDKAYGTYGYDPYDYDPLWKSITGGLGISQRDDWDAATMRDNIMSMYSENPEIMDTIKGMLPDVNGLSDFFAKATDGQYSVEHLNDVLQTLIKSLGEDVSNASTKGRDSLSSYKNEIDNFARGGADAQKAMTSMVDKTQDLNDKLYALRQYEKGTAKKQDYSDLSKLIGIDADVLQKATGKQKEMFIQSGKAIIEPESVEISSAWDEMFNSAIEQLYADAEQYGMDPVEVTKAINLLGAGDVSGFQAVVSDMASDAENILIQLFAYLATLQGTFTTEAIKTGKNAGQIRVKTNFGGGGGFGSSRSGKGGSGGGGGGGKDNGKSDAEILVERLKHGRELYEHQHKMVEYDVSRYQNTDQLTMYAHALEAEINLERSYLPVLKDNINAIKAQMEATESGTEDWYKLRDALFDAEEKYEDITNSIEDNTKKLKENQEAIRQTRIKLEEMVLEEIKNRIQQQKDMLDATINMEDALLDAIKKRYEDEWDRQVPAN